MSLFAILCFSSVLINIEANLPGVCKVVTAKNSIFQKGKFLNGYQFYRSTTVPDMIQCARNCFFRRRCLSFNYNEKYKICEFNNVRFDPPDTLLSTSLTYIYSDIRDWDKAIGMGPCGNQPCDICEACYPTESNYTCVKEELTSCQDIKVCTNATSDDHYLIRPMIGKKPWLKIYCHKMATKYPKDYLTLIEKNFALYPPLNSRSCDVIDWNMKYVSYTTYMKIRLDVTRLLVVRSDNTFTHLSCDPKLFGLTSGPHKKCTYRLSYAIAADCIASSCKPRRGEFRVDLRGTGLIVAPSTTWKPYGWIGSITYVKHSSSNQVVIGVCGGNCGGCSPFNLYLEPKP